MSNLFDLNIEDVLEHWEVRHGIREVIANALDEQVLTGTASIEAYRRGATVIVRDYGRGLSIRHLTMNESPEKLQAPEGVIGKFGVGLKDALATFHRHRVAVEIASSHGTFSLVNASKHGFEEITTLHIRYESGGQLARGTEVRLTGVSSGEFEAARDFFLHFTDHKTLERTPYGAVLSRGRGDARVYINGVLAAEEPDFLFSYDITNLTRGMRKKLNRERLNIGRTIYSSRVKDILLAAESESVTSALADELAERGRRRIADELSWVDVATRAVEHSSREGPAVFVTEEESIERPELIDLIRRDGTTIRFVTEQEREKIRRRARELGEGATTLDDWHAEYQASFRYDFIEPSDLSLSERKIFARTPQILSLVTEDATPPVRISSELPTNTRGVWRTPEREIVILRECLQSIEEYAGVLLHELAHSSSGASDVSRRFELELTEFLGKTAVVAIGNPWSNGGPHPMAPEPSHSRESSRRRAEKSPAKRNHPSGASKTSRSTQKETNPRHNGPNPRPKRPVGAAGASDEWPKGTKVTHSAFGSGVVRRTEAHKVEVEFEMDGKLRLLDARVAKLKRL